MGIVNFMDGFVFLELIHQVFLKLVVVYDGDVSCYLNKQVITLKMEHNIYKVLVFRFSSMLHAQTYGYSLD